MPRPTVLLALWSALGVGACVPVDPDGCNTHDPQCDTGGASNPDSGTPTDSGAGDSGAEDSGAEDSGAEDSGAVSDADGDGHEVPDDCDDTDATVFPGADDWCGDGIDGDCDGEDVTCLHQGEERNGDYSYATGTSSGLGWPIVTGPDVSGDGVPDMLVASPYQYFVDVLSWNGAATVENPGWVQASPEDGAGYNFTSGDIDGDGMGDVLVTEPLWADSSASGATQGRVWLASGPITGRVDIIGSDTGFTRILGDTGDTLAMMAVGDLDGDGAPDLMVGSDAANGQAYLIYGPVTQGGDLAIESELGSAWWTAGTGGQGIGTRVRSHDATGDGIDDMLILSRGSGSAAPGIWIVEGDDATRHAGEALVSTGTDTELVGPDGSGGNECWYPNLENAGDVDGDGFEDLMIGHPEQSEEGVRCGIDAPGPGLAWLLRGPLTTSGGWDELAAATFTGEDDGDHFGSDALGAGDINGDGRGDVIITAPCWSVASTSAYRCNGAPYGDAEGAAYTFLGPLSGAVDPATDRLGFVDGPPGYGQGTGVGALGDRNDDGHDDWVLGMGAGGLEFFLGGPE